MASGVSLTWPHKDTGLFVLQVIDKYADHPATISMIARQLNTNHGHVYLSLLGRNITEAEVRGLITRLVNKGYVKREGTNVLRWYTLTSMGRGYISEEVKT